MLVDEKKPMMKEDDDEFEFPNIEEKEEESIGDDDEYCLLDVKEQEVFEGVCEVEEVEPVVFYFCIKLIFSLLYRGCYQEPKG